MLFLHLLRWAKIFLFYLITMEKGINTSAKVKAPFHYREKPNLAIKCGIFFNATRWFAKILFRILHTYLLEIVIKFPFSYCLNLFGHKDFLILIELAREWSLLLSFPEHFESKTGIICALNVLLELAHKKAEPSFHIMERFLKYWFNFCCYYSTVQVETFESVLVICIFLETCLFHLYFKTYWQKDVPNIPLLTFKSLLSPAVTSLSQS